MFTISMHMQECTNKSCPNRKECYHLKRDKILTSNEIPLWRSDMIGEAARLCRFGEAQVYYSMCQVDTTILDIAMNTPNFNITLPCDLYKDEKVKLVMDKHPDKFQVSVYDLTQVIFFDKFQKIYLIKDPKTLEEAKWMSVIGDNLHFAVDMSTLRKLRAKKIMTMYKECKNPTISLDSCMEHYALNGTCVYQKDYIDLNYDGTWRKCVFSSTGKMNLECSLKELMALANEEPVGNCKYNDLFAGEK